MKVCILFNSLGLSSWYNGIYTLLVSAFNVVEVVNCCKN